MIETSLNKKFPGKFDEINNESILCLKSKSSSKIIQDILRKIEVLLYIEKRSNRRVKAFGIDDIQEHFYGKGYDKAHDIILGNSCHSTARYLSGEDSLGERRKGEIMIRGKFVRHWNSKIAFQDDGWEDTTLEESIKKHGFPCMGIVNGGYNSDGSLDSLHSFIVLGKEDGKYICFEQYDTGGNFRFFNYTTNHYIEGEGTHSFRAIKDPSV